MSLCAWEIMREAVATYLRAKLSADHLVTTRIEEATSCLTHIEACSVLLTYGGFTRTPEKGLNTFLSRTHSLHLNCKAFPTTEDALLSKLYATGNAVADFLDDPAQYGSPPFGIATVTDISLIAGTLIPASSSNDSTSFHMILNINTMV